MSGRWAVYVVVYIVPLDDIVEHSQSPTCICGPQLLETQLADGSAGSQLVHASMDGRELTQRSST
jgi:hypothetical protein